MLRSGRSYPWWSRWITVFAIVYLLVTLVRAQGQLPAGVAPGDYFNAKREVELLNERFRTLDELHLERYVQRVDDMNSELAYQRTLLNGITVALIAQLVLGALDWRKRRNGA